MHLGAFIYPTGHHLAAWRDPRTVADAGVNIRHYIELARLAEHGRFDMLFFADTNAMGSSNPRDLFRLATRYVAQFEPTTLVGALSAVTDRIGLVATASTTYNEPFHLARRFASLDHLSGGRVGWNLVTSSEPAEAANFGRHAHVGHANRYIRAREFANVVKGLWNTFEDDAFPRDREAGVFFDPAKMHVLNHNGDNFSVRGPLNIPRSPQGNPVIVQAGASEEARQLAAETAEVLFTAHPKIEPAREFYTDTKRRMPAFGRSPEELKILPGLFVVYGETRQEAERHYAHLQSLIHPEIILSNLSHDLGVDLSGHDVDGPVPRDLPETEGNKNQQKMMLQMAQDGNLSLRQLHARFSAGRGHVTVMGDAATIADTMQEWVSTGACDGFNVLIPMFPKGLEDFVHRVVPELQRRGIFRREYQGRTLREHLGLKRPAHPMEKRAMAVTD